MSRMKRYTFTIVAVVVGLGIVSSGIFSDPCDQPLAYRIGVLDERFNISTSTARSILKEAETVWEASVDRQLFTYDPEADFEINFIYDDRQQTTNEVNEYESTLSELEMTHGEVTALYEERRSRYQNELTSYKDNRLQYEANLRAYNERVQEWNNRGGAPSRVYEDLQQQRRQLDQQLATLQEQQREVEELRQAVNELVSQGNSLARQYNETASTFTQRFGTSQEFNQATYTGEAINVYQFEQRDDLRLALAHEFGHSLGIEHVSSSRSIMYYLMEDQPLNNPSLSQQDMTAFSNVCSNV